MKRKLLTLILLSMFIGITMTSNVQAASQYDVTVTVKSIYLVDDEDFYGAGDLYVKIDGGSHHGLGSHNDGLDCDNLSEIQIEYDLYERTVNCYGQEVNTADKTETLRGLSEGYTFKVELYDDDSATSDDLVARVYITVLGSGSMYYYTKNGPDANNGAFNVDHTSGARQWVSVRFLTPYSMYEVYPGSSTCVGACSNIITALESKWTYNGFYLQLNSVKLPTSGGGGGLFW